ncbi:hypothetical protein L0128_08565, partial [candidate division KSB1 bacterium]|nr:hypothetical protein [candidate division KSB1 bacterium]
MQKSNSAGMVFFLLFVALGIGWGRPAASARGSDAILTSSIVTQRTWPENLPDDTTTRVNPALRLRRPAEVPPVTHSDRFAPETISAPRQFQSISQYLAALTPVECRHAKLYFEFAPDFAATARAAIQTIVTCWQQGDYAGALQKLKMLENQGLTRQLAVGIEWQNPPAFQKPAWGADIRVGTPTNVRAVGLDFDATSQHLFIITRYQDGNVFYWTINYSDNNGQSWTEKFRWGSVADLTNVSMTVVSGYCYVGYNLGNAARLRRFSVTTGNPDTGFDYITVFTKSYAITDLALSSNGDGYNDRVWYTAILANQSLVWYIFEPPTTTWYEAATNITDAASGLDASEDAGFATGSTDYYYWFSYLTASNRLHVVRVKNVGANRVLENIELGDAIGGTSISAFHGIIITAYEYNFTNGKGIRYHISYDHGATWYVGAVAEPAAPGASYYEIPDVTARRDGGIAIVYQEETGATDRCWYRTRDYGTGPNSGWSWSSPVQMNEVDVVTGFPLAIEWLPPAPGYGYAYGITWIGGSDVAAYFDRTDILPRQINLTIDQGNCSYSFVDPLLNIQIRVTSNGTLAAGPSYLGYYLATSPNELNTYIKIGDDYVPGLNPGSYSDQSLTGCNVSSLGLAGGTYYVCFIVDYQSQVTESNEDDNSWYFTTPIQLQSNWPTTYKLLVPNGNEAWRTGKSQTVLWNCDHYTGQVKVELSTDWGNSWRDVPGGSSAVNSGNFSFTPAAGDVGGNCQMRVTSIQNPNASDRTDYKFSIFNAIKHYVAQQVPAEMSEPAIDGHLNDPIWAQINPSELLQFGGLPEDFLSPWTDFADNRVTWRAVWSARTNLLYVAVEIQDDQAGASDHGYDQLWQDDCIEIFTDGNRDGGFFAPANIDAQQWFVRR